jgi:hypothetical protein
MKGFEGFPERARMSENVIMAEISAKLPEDGMMQEAQMIIGVPRREYIERNSFRGPYVTPYITYDMLRPGGNLTCTVDGGM